LTYLAGHLAGQSAARRCLAGLPIEDGILHPGALRARRCAAGLEAQLMERPLEKFQHLLPAVLLFMTVRPRILLGIDRDANRVTLADPTREVRDIIELLVIVAAQYTGFAYFVRPAHVADPRAVAGDVPRKHWFWSVVKQFGANYSHVAIAAFIVNILALATPLFTMSVYDRVIPNGASRRCCVEHRARLRMFRLFCGSCARASST
jgi:ATP-binding cassette subfamily C protein LapB